jgi:hypothetical protein
VSCQSAEFNRFNDVHQEQVRKYGESLVSDPAKMAETQREATPC